jgi:hypothetical protein
VWITDLCVRRMGDVTPLRYCVMCLADGEKVAATHLAEVGGKEIGYCAPCSETMARTGHVVRRLDAVDTTIA